MSPRITEMVVESKKTLKLPNGDYVSELRSIRVGFEENELCLNPVPKDVDAGAYMTGLGRMAESKVAEALEPYLADGEYKTQGAEAPAEIEEEPEPLTDKQRKAIYGKAGALDQLDQEGLAKAIINTHLKDADIPEVSDLTKGQASNLLDTLEREIEKLKEAE